jgi:hypothetical protein
MITTEPWGFWIPSIFNVEAEWDFCVEFQDRDKPGGNEQEQCAEDSGNSSVKKVDIAICLGKFGVQCAIRSRGRTQLGDMRGVRGIAHRCLIGQVYLGIS